MSSIATLVHRISPRLRENLATARERFSVPKGRPPRRSHIERRLRAAGLDCVVIGDSRRYGYALALAAPGKLLAWGALTLIWIMSSLVLVWMWLDREATYRFFNFLPFDVLAGVTLVLSLFGWHLLRQRGDKRLARSVALTGLGVAGIVAAAPHLLFSLAHFDTTAAGWLSASEIPPGAERQSLLPHIGIGIFVAGVVAIEAGQGPAGRLWYVTKASLRTMPRTLVDVLRTLPTVLTVLFFAGFVEETWRIFGGMPAQRVAAVMGLLFLCVVGLVMRLAREEAEKALELESLSGAVAGAAEQDSDIGALKNSGATVRAADVTRADIRTAVIRQWRFRILLRIILAGVIVAALMVAVTSLTMSEGLLNDWLTPTPLIDEKYLGVHIYLVTEAFSVAAVLGSFASVVFAASALGASESRNEMLEPERKRLRDLLALAGTYESADEKTLWRGKPGQKWDTYPEFLSDYPDRRESPDVFGSDWRSGNGRARWRLEYNRKTGEVYTWRKRPPGEVEVLAVCHDHDWVTRRLEQLAQGQHEPDSVSSLRERTQDLVEGSHSAR